MSAVTGVIATFYEKYTLSYDERGKVFDCELMSYKEVTVSSNGHF